LVATIKTVPGKRDEYLKHLKAHAQRCLATEPGTLKFEILVPQDEADTVMLYEAYASRRPSRRIGTACPSSKPSGTLEA
jgi:quinol monooxygenase YgiN